MKTASVFPFVLFQAFAAISISGQTQSSVFDHVRNAYLESGDRWMEIGHSAVTAERWVTIQATYSNFKDPVVFLSLPNLSGETTDDGTSLSLRVKDATLSVVDSSTSYFEFKAKSFNVNTSFCTEINTFYTPFELKINSSYLGWLVVEKGMFSISDKRLIIHSDAINRTDSDVKYNLANQFKSMARGVCFGGQDCELGAVSTPLSIAQLQTARYEQYLLLRGVEVARNYVVYVLQPHDSTLPAGYYFPDPGEEYAWMLFEEGVHASCANGIALDSIGGLTSGSRTTVYYPSSFISPPTLFGMVNTLVGRDATGLRIFNIDTGSASVIAQEDKCSDAETAHVSPEGISFFLAGHAAVGSVSCGVAFDSSAPTDAPTPVPTATPSLQPTAEPSVSPTARPTHVPSVAPSYTPTVAPTAVPTENPTFVPTAAPSASPTFTPTAIPTAPTVSPTSRPTTEVASVITVTGATTLTGAACSNTAVLSAFQDALAETLEIGSNEVAVTDCTDVARRLRENQQNTQRYLFSFAFARSYSRALSDTSIDLDFTLEFVIEEKGFTDPAAAFDSVDTMLSAAIEDGALVDKVKTLSGENITMSSMSMNSFSVEQTRTIAPTSSPTSEDTTTDFWGGTFFVVLYGVAGGILLLLSCLSCYYFVVKSREENNVPVKKSKPFHYAIHSDMEIYGGEEGGVQNANLDLLVAGKADMELVIALLTEHRRLNSKLRIQLKDKNASENDPALLRFIIDSFEPSRLSREHKKFLRDHLRKLRAENNLLWARSVQAGVNKQESLPEILKLKYSEVEHFSTSSVVNNTSMAIHLSIAAGSACPHRPISADRESYSISNTNSDSASLSRGQSSELLRSEDSSSNVDFDGSEFDSSSQPSSLEARRAHMAEEHSADNTVLASRRFHMPVELGVAPASSKDSNESGGSSEYSPCVPRPGELTMSNVSALHPLQKSFSLEDVLGKSFAGRAAVQISQTKMVTGLLEEQALAEMSTRFGETRRRKQDLETFRRVHTVRHQRRRSADAANLGLFVAPVNQEDKFDPYAMWDVPRTAARKQTAPITGQTSVRSARGSPSSSLGVIGRGVAAPRNRYSAALPHSLSTVEEDSRASWKGSEDGSISPRSSTHE